MSCHLAAATSISLALISLMAVAQPQQRVALTPTPPLQLALDSPGTVIVAPQAGEYPALAARLAEGLAAVTQQKPRIVADTTAVDALGAGPVLVLGNLMDNHLARSLYLHAYDFTDYSWPSPGGHVVRTIRDPLGTGAHVLMLGGSDPAGVAAAVDALLAHVRARGPKLGYLNLVHLGKWAAEIIGFTGRYLGDDAKTWTRVGGAGSWDYQQQIGRAGVGYLRTGDERYLPVFQRELRCWFDHYVLNLRTDAPPQSHGFLHSMLMIWDLVRDHPSFTAQERLKLDEDFLVVYRSGEGPARIKGASQVRRIRDNHGTRTGLDGMYGGRFFLRRFGGSDPAVATQAKEWLSIADAYFTTQMGSAKPVEDSWGHQWAASLYDTLLYAMLADRTEYFTAQALRQAADRALIAHARAGAPRGYLSALAVATGDTGYLSGFTAGEGYGQRCAGMNGTCNELLRGFCTNDPVRERQDLLGVKVAPLDQLWYGTIDAAGFNPGDLFTVTVPREQGFDKLSVREGWGGNDYYLLLDGISGGHHSYEDGNCIIMLQEAGAMWSARTGRSLSESGTVKSSNGVAIALDGSGPGRLHRYARLLYSGESAGYMAVGTAFEGVGDADWQRHIIRKRGQWTLVVDRVLARREGEALAERHWYLRGELTPRADGLTAVQSVGAQRRALHLQTAGVLPEGMSGTTDRVEAVRAPVRPGQPLEFATLLHVSPETPLPAGALQVRALDQPCTGAPAAPAGIGRLTDLGIVVLRATQPGNWLEMPFRLAQPVAGEVAVDLLGFTDRGPVRVLLDGKQIVARYEHRAAGVVSQRVSLGRYELAAGEHRLRLEVVGDPPADGKCYIGLGGLLVTPGTATALPAPGQPVYSLTRTAAGWRVEGQGHTEVITVGEQGAAGFPAWQVGQPAATPSATSLQAAPVDLQGLLPLHPQVAAAPLPWRALKLAEAPITAVVRAADGRVAAGDAKGAVGVFSADGKRVASAEMESQALALHFLGEDLLVGEDRGALTRLGPDGATRWQVVIPYEPMPWDYWSEYRSRVREITSADLNGDGQAEILLSNSDRRVHAFTGDGRLLWRAPVEWGIFTGMTPGSFGGKFALFGGTSRPSIHGRCLIFPADGGRPQALTRPDLVSWSVPSQFRDMRLVDLNGDGVTEIINAVDTNCRQLVVYREDGKVLWDADMAGAAEALAVKGDTIYGGGNSGYVAAFAGATGKRLWACYLGEPVVLLALTAEGRLAAVTPAGRVFLVGPGGQLEGRVELGSSVSAVMRPGDHRVGEKLLVGTKDGRVIAQ
ncbi:PQQ-binding-like beta-propeller repeat protein [bacterium]|nr:PQQ-binding-like beta-propeller repeat protein [bacterium]